MLLANAGCKPTLIVPSKLFISGEAKYTSERLRLVSLTGSRNHDGMDSSKMEKKNPCSAPLGNCSLSGYAVVSAATHCALVSIHAMYQ